jgi:hypothetical protein
VSVAKRSQMRMIIVASVSDLIPVQHSGQRMPVSHL